ncbi:hypothetical protein [Bradyrhizobium sp. RDI18]|uniref:hypothetical protein n=1 Tax=Bradyrhizobium sp. RDI18 TaxID=3367400 RepID=UPI003714D788
MGKEIGAVVLPTGSIRCAQAGRIEELPGYLDGAWWVQDAAAALPVKLMGDVAGLSVLDLCAAPGGRRPSLRPPEPTSPPSINPRAVSAA